MRHFIKQSWKFLYTLLLFCGDLQLKAQNPITVTDCNLQGWTKQFGAGNTLLFKNGVGTTPLGNGSLEFNSTPGTTPFVRFRNNNYHKKALADISAFSYDTYIQSRGNTTDVNYVVLQVDINGDETFDHTLVFSPWYQIQPYIGSNFPDQGPTLTGTWQTWDMLHGAWWIGPLNDPDHGGELFTLATYISRNPTARILNASGVQGGGIRLTSGAAQGSGIFTTNFIGNADKFTIGIKDVITIYDFEFSTFTTPNAGPDKTVVYGYGSNCIELNGTAAGGFPPYNYTWAPGGNTPNAASTIVCPTTTTTYTLTVSDVNGCTRNDQVTVYVNDVRCGNKMDKVKICHAGEEICVASAAVQAHLDHGDLLGACPASLLTTAIKKTYNLLPGQLNMFNYPNPSSKSTTIQFELPVAGKVSIKLYDFEGKELATLVNENKLAGIHLFEFNTEKFKPGMYFYKIIVLARNNMMTQIKKLMKI